MKMKVVNSALELIGETPLIKLNHLVPEGAADVYLKLESFNVAGSIKDRTALSMIEGAEREGLIKPGETTLVDSTSGNTGIGLALVAALKGYRLVIVMSELASIERRKLLQAYGAEIDLVPASPKGILADMEELDRLVDEKGYFPLRQFENKYNPYIHKTTTGPEIYEQLDGKIDAFVSAVGTGGTFTGIAEYLKEQNKDILTYAVEPEGSPVLRGGKPGPHKIPGIGSGIIPAILNREIIDEVIDVSDENAAETAKQLALKEGLFVGPSSGAATYAAIEKAKILGKGKTIVAIAPDGGDRYVSQL